MSVSKQDIITAIKNSDTFLKVPELQGAKPRLNKNGSPFAFVGGFNMVFQLEHQNKKWAFRVWHVPMGEHTNRYRKISKYLSEKKLPYFADFIYDERGILVNGNFLDTIRMEWLEGKLLKEYLEDNLINKSKLIKLANDFLEMCKTLRDNKISHGDLQEGNILIDRNENIKLVDYDSICIPVIEGQKELVTGLKGYQHPSRFNAEKASLKADYFSELVIYLSILALSENSNLWNKYQVKDTLYLLFTESDFEDFENSEIYKDLQILSNSIKSLTRILNSYLSERSYLNLNPIEHYLTAPEIRSFNTNKKEILKGNSIELTWKIENFDKISISNGIGNVTGKNLISVTPTQTIIYKLTAENAFGISEQEVKIEVLPLPKIKELRAKHQKIEFGKETEIIWDFENVEKVELHYAGNLEVLSNKGSRIIVPEENTKYKIIFTALDGITKDEKEIQVFVYKPIEIHNFSTSLDFVIETVTFKLSWDINEASELKLYSNAGFVKDVSAINSIELEAKKGQELFWIEAKNDLFKQVTNKLKLRVESLPKPINPIISFGDIQLPSIDLANDLNILGQEIIPKNNKLERILGKKNIRFELGDFIEKLFKELNV